MHRKNSLLVSFSFIEDSLIARFYCTIRKDTASIMTLSPPYISLFTHIQNDSAQMKDWMINARDAGL